MEQLIITLEGKTNAELLMRLLSKFNFVKSVTREKIPSADVANIVNESSEAYNWTNPSRQATDEEFELMIAEAEAEEGIPAEEARALTMKKLAEWRKQNRK